MMIFSEEKPREKTGTGEDSRPQPNASVALAYDGKRFFQRIHGDLSFIFVHNQRRRDADGARTAAQEEHSAFKRQLYDPVALGRAVFFAILVLDDLYADHQAAAANVANQPVLAWPVCHALQHVMADLRGVAQKIIPFDDIQRG